MEHIERLCTLFTDNIHDIIRDMLVNISNVGVIAGGSMVYALNNFVPVASVGDIDVFVNNKENYITIMNIIRSYFNEVDYYIISLKPNIIMNIVLPEQRVHIQLIWWEFSDPMNIIDNFDFDYVQCAFHQREVIMTHACLVSHMNREVSIITRTCAERYLLSARVRKALAKGFRVPWIVDVTNDNQPRREMSIDSLFRCRYPSVIVKTNTNIFK